MWSQTRVLLLSSPLSSTSSKSESPQASPPLGSWDGRVSERVADLTDLQSVAY